MSAVGVTGLFRIERDVRDDSNYDSPYKCNAHVYFVKRLMHMLDRIDCTHVVGTPTSDNLIRAIVSRVPMQHTMHRNSARRTRACASHRARRRCG